MNIYFLVPKQRMGREQYSAAVVIAASEEEARFTHPNGVYFWNTKTSRWDADPQEAIDMGLANYMSVLDSWVDPYDVEVGLLGKACDDYVRQDCGVVMANFNQW